MSKYIGNTLYVQNPVELFIRNMFWGASMEGKVSPAPQINYLCDSMLMIFSVGYTETGEKRLNFHPQKARCPSAADQLKVISCKECF